MIVSHASKALARTCQTVGRLPSNSQPHILSLQLIQRRCKQTKTKTEKFSEEKPKKSRKLVKAVSLAAVGTAIAVVTAKHDDDFRDWTRENFHALDDLVKIIYEEEETYLQFLARAHKELSEWFKDVVYNALKAIQEPGGSKSGGPVKEVCEEAKKPYKPPESAFLVKKDDKKDGKQESSTSSKSTESIPKHLKELKELEDRLTKKAQETIQSYHVVLCAMNEQANFIDNLDQMISKHDSKIWVKFGKKKRDEEKFLDKAESALKAVENTTIKLKEQLENNHNLPLDVQVKAKNNLRVVMSDVKKAKDNFEKEKVKFVLAKRSWDKVRRARMHFSEELETLFPNVWLNDEKLNLPLDSLDPFIQNVVDNILLLEKEMAKLQTIRDSEATSACENFKSTNDPEGLIAAIVNLEGSKEKRIRQEETQKLLLSHRAKCDKNSRVMMKQQAEVYNDLKAEALNIKEREVERKMQQLLEEKLANVRAEQRMEIAKMVGRIQGANEAIGQRGDKDKEQQEKQQFWSAAQSLLASIQPIGAAGRKHEPKPLKNEITNVSKVAPDGDELVESVLKSIPAEAAEHGVHSECQLKERFLKLQKEARKMAGVPSGEVTLVQVFLGRLQSALYIDEPIPQEELANEPIDVESLNNYEIIHRAGYYVDNGELDQAVRYLNLLKGPSGILASDWIKDVVVYLETRQAAELLLAHASATSLQV